MPRGSGGLKSDEATHGHHKSEFDPRGASQAGSKNMSKGLRHRKATSSVAKEGEGVRRAGRRASDHG